jgi:type IV pilus assembly protein PilY1
MRASNSSTVGNRMHRVRARIGALVVAFAATVAGLPVNAAITIPSTPLQDGSSIPPNIMFILDNSGSMALISMPFDVQDQSYSGTATGADRTGLNDDPTDRSYMNNSIYYNPGVDYEPWMKADGTRMTGGQDYTSVFTSWNSASNSDGTRDLRNSSESIFYVPETNVTASKVAGDFIRNRIRTSGGDTQVVRGTKLASWNWTENINEGNWSYRQFSVPAGTQQLIISVSGDANPQGDADLYVRRTANPTTSTNDFESEGGSSSESLVINSPQSGTWRVGVYADSGGGNRDVVGATLSVVAQGAEQPVTYPSPKKGGALRTQEEELRNFATWYSYFRSRLKTAKAGSLEAFGTLGSDFRVGYTPINGRSSDLSASGTSPIIPVDNIEGRFEAANKSAWFTSVVGETVQAGSTPLRTTLNAVGQYYLRSDEDGPWGPGDGNDQLACRQSFSILTTDGYWNDSTNSTFGRGDEDGDGDSVTLADIARYYYRSDLRGDLPNEVPGAAGKPNWQHMVTFGISIGLRGSLPITNPAPDPDAAIWPNPMDGEDLHRIDDLWHAAVNSDGRFVAANNPAEFTSGLRSALQSISDRTGAASNVSANSTSVGTETNIYQAVYRSGRWTGDLKAFPVTSSGGVAATPEWEASRNVPAHGSRNILFNLSSSGAGQGRFLTWDNLTPTQQAALGGGSTGQFILDYLRGDGSKEQRNPSGTLRDRTQIADTSTANVLGDIVHSSPVFVDTDPDGNPATDDGTKTVYVGANDGMLHAFDAENGVERFAFIPASVSFSDLQTLADPDYAHKYFVDGEIVVSNRQQTPGRNILVGLMGRGGKSVYALDVSNPDSFGEGDVLWEFTDPDLGNAVGEPIITKLNNGRTAVIFGNGYNSDNGNSVLFVVDIIDGTLIRKFDTGVGGDNGMAAPRGWDANRSGTFDFLYAGDLLGNVWKIDISASSSATWGFSVLNGGNPAPIIQARDSGGNVQPITAGLAIGLNPSTFARWIFFGTGRYLTSGDPQDRSKQSWYGFEDAAIDTVAEQVARADLKPRAIPVTKSVQNLNTPEPDDEILIRQFETAVAGDMVGKKGWVVDLETPADVTDGGERIVTRSVFAGSVLLASSIIPGSNACRPGGRGFLNFIDPFTGGATSFFDLNADGTVDANDLVDGAPISSLDPGGGMPTMPVVLRDDPGGKVKVVVGGSAGQQPQDVPGVLPGAWGRISWREVIRN